MREILFRGKRLDNGEWVEGFYQASPSGNHYITYICAGGAHPDKVNPNTVGQYTGLCDKNGKKIFEGDILEGRDYDEEDGYGVVVWDDGAFFIGNGSFSGTFYDNYYGEDFEVIGNIHDNPELLKGTEHGKE